MARDCSAFEHDSRQDGARKPRVAKPVVEREPTPPELQREQARERLADRRARKVIPMTHEQMLADRYPVVAQVAVKEGDDWNAVDNPAIWNSDGEPDD